MIVEKNQIFNLMDTNGRRSDVLNALKIYLEILEELKESHPLESWGTYPDSLAQFLFYEKALQKSSDVFKVHSKYDKFIEDLGSDYDPFINRDCEWIEDNLNSFANVLDESIEKRARHYTSNLVKMGFTTANRKITEAGYSYLKGIITRDPIEDLLPLDNINIALIRQLAKLKIFSIPDSNGNRQYYSPFLMALALLLGGESIDNKAFEVIVQGLTPYSSDFIKKKICDNNISIDTLEDSIKDIEVIVPPEIKGALEIDAETFKSIFKSSKNNNAISTVYYEFYLSLKDFRDNRNNENYLRLVECFDENSSLLNKAFGYGKAVFNIGNRGNRFTIEKFLEKNENHPLLTATDYASDFYTAFAKSKWIDGIREYSDTTLRLLSATGLFKFKNLPELAYKDVLSLIFDVNKVHQNIFGEFTEEEYIAYETSDDCYYGKSISISQIFSISNDDTMQISNSIQKLLGVSGSDGIKGLLKDKKNAEFISHISEKYPKEKILELLPLFSDRRNDRQIKNEVNDSASVPTIYEYIIGIAWYYISNEEFDLYSSLNLTLNADFEPVIHAGGGDGDIVISYTDINIMLEVTLMNKQAQKRGEWEPVLRHSLNLKAESEPKETLTFFIADELDFNTINIWRAVAAAPLESTNTHTLVDGVIIMPFTNSDILNLLEKNVYYKDIVKEVKRSFALVPKITDVKWHEDVIASLVN